MIQPDEIKSGLAIELFNGSTTTHKVWDMLSASKHGNLELIKHLVADEPALAYCKYNYTPPIHFAVREGHVPVTKYLLECGAFEPDYESYPFLETLLLIAKDRGHKEIANLLLMYDPSQFKYGKDWNGRIHFQRSPEQTAFEQAVDKEYFTDVKAMLQDHPEFALDNTFFWGEGILMMPARDGNREMLELLISYGARVPPISKWGQFYYFKHTSIAAFLLENGMNPMHMSWHHVTLLHDMVQKGEIDKAALLIKHGSEIDPLEEEYQSTPLGLAAKWGKHEMVEYLLKQGADPNRAGAAWSTPLAWAVKKGHSAIETILRKAGAK
jgi:uncharacterized protein